MNNKNEEMYQAITDRVIAQLESGIIPWKKEWKTGNKTAYNIVSKQAYSPLNQMLLSHVGAYASFKQWKDKGGKIKKGAKAEYVYFWKLLNYPKTEEKVNEETGETETVNGVRTIPFLQRYAVFHVSDVDGIEPPEESETAETEKLPDAEIMKVINNYSQLAILPIFYEEQDNAYYNPTKDCVVLPTIQQFNSLEAFYSTAFHELTHSTGSATRLKRCLLGGFGSPTYAKEELCAEMGSQFICNKLGISTENTFDNSVAYIQSWLKALKNDKTLIVSASGKAEKASEYILSFSNIE